MFDVLLAQRHLLAALLIFVGGLYMVVTSRHILKRILGINVMGAGVFYFLVSIGNVENGFPPILGAEEVLFINPLPSALILTGIVVVVSITVYSLSLAIKIYELYGSLDQKDILNAQEEVSS